VAAAEGHPGGLGMRYRVRLHLFPADAVEKAAQLSFAQVAAAFDKAFVPLFQVRRGARVRVPGVCKPPVTVGRICLRIRSPLCAPHTVCKVVPSAAASSLSALMAGTGSCASRSRYCMLPG